MPALARTVFLGLHAAALLATVGPAPCPLAALAAPIPAPNPLMPHLADYASRPPALGNPSVVPQVNNLPVSEQDQDVAVVKHTTSTPSPIAQRQAESLASKLTVLSKQADLISSLASTAGTDPGNNEQFASSITTYQLALLDFKNLLGDQQKGLANYDPDNDIESLLKELTNCTKKVLAAIYRIVDSVPVVGPVLGPIVYEVKCILDDVLDLTENLSDGLLNALNIKQLLQVTIADTTTVICLLGLCPPPR